MGIKFLGTDLKSFDQLIKEEEIVMIRVETYKEEEIGYPSPEGVHFVRERVQTGGWGVQIRSSKDIIQVDDGDGEYLGKKDLSDMWRKKLR